MHKAYLLAAAGAALSAPAQAATVLDANYTPASAGTGIVIRNDVTTAQTFTVLTTGFLTSVSTLINRSTSVSSPLTVQIRTTTGGVPTLSASGTNVLGSVSVAANTIGTAFTWTAFNFDAIAVTAGQQLAIVLQSDSLPDYNWAGDLAWSNFSTQYRSGTYSGGQGYLSRSGAAFGGVSLCNGVCNDPARVDFGFRTFISDSVSPVPEPAGWAMMMLGFGCVGYGIRSRKVARIRIA